MDVTLRSVRAVFVVVCLGAGAAGSACDSPVRPGAPPSTPPIVVPPTSSAGVLAVTGPVSIPPGGSGQYHAIVTTSDGVSTDVTSTAEWIVNDRRILEMNAPGRFVGRERGESWVKARVGRADWNFRVRVHEDGTFKFSGRIVERFTGTEVGVSAMLEVLEGVGAGLRESTADGWFNFFGVAGTIRVRVTAPGYAVEEFGQVVGEGTHRVVPMASLASGVNLGGQWMLTTVVGAECGWPGDRRSRQLILDVNHGGSPFFEARAIGSDVATAKFVRGRIDGRAITITLPYSRPYEDWYSVSPAEYSIVQVDAALGRVGIGGELKLALEGSSAAGEFVGALDIQGPSLVPGVRTVCDTRGPATLQRR